MRSLVVRLTPAAKAGLRLEDYGATMLTTLRDFLASASEDLPIHCTQIPVAFSRGLHGKPGLGPLIADPPAEPGRWRIALNGSRSPDWWEHPGPLVALLAEVLSATVRVPFFPGDFPSPEPRFVPATG